MRITATPVVGPGVDWDDPAWPYAHEYRLVNALTRTPVRHETRVRVLSSPDALWLRYECDADRIAATMTRYKDKVWTEGAVEAYLMPLGADYLYEFQVSPLGTRRDLRVDAPGRERQAYVDDWTCPGFTASARIRVDSVGEVLGWDALIRIPWSDIDTVNAGADRWMLGLFRWEHHPEEFSGLTCQPGVDPHDPSFLAVLTPAPAATLEGTDR